jgi:hypothetical protein
MNGCTDIMRVGVYMWTGAAFDRGRCPLRAPTELDRGIELLSKMTGTQRHSLARHETRAAGRVDRRADDAPMAAKGSVRSEPLPAPLPRFRYWEVQGRSDLF